MLQATCVGRGLGLSLEGRGLHVGGFVGRAVIANCPRCSLKAQACARSLGKSREYTNLSSLCIFLQEAMCNTSVPSNSKVMRTGGSSTKVSCVWRVQPQPYMSSRRPREWLNMLRPLCYGRFILVLPVHACAVAGRANRIVLHPTPPHPDHCCRYAVPRHRACRGAAGRGGVKKEGS